MNGRALGEDVRRRLLALPPASRKRFADWLDADEAPGVDAAWEVWAHDGQEPPPGDWQTWVIMAGRGFGKTRAGAEWVAQAARADGRLSIALVAATLDEARRIMVEGNRGLLTVAHDQIADWSPSRRLLRFTSGARATLFSGASPAQLRGPEHHIAWCDELAKWEKPQDAWDMLQLGLRLGTRPRVLVTTTPRPGPLLSRIMARPDCVTTGGRTYANPHVSAAYVATIRDMYAGTRLARQEIDGELLGAAGALWTVDLIARCRREGVGSRGAGSREESSAAGTKSLLPAPPFTRTLIAVDPPSGEGTCGIIACARDTEGHVHVLADHSVTGRSPEGWAQAVTGAAQAHDTREVIAESNQGGRMVKSILLTADPMLHVRLVHARHGKAERAEPVAHLFEAGKAWFAGRFPELEAQLLGLIAGGGYDGPGTSPDRADAMVWGLSTLAKGESVVRVRVV